MRRPLLIGVSAGALVLTLVVVGTVIAVGVIDRDDALAERSAAATRVADSVAAMERAIAEADEVVAVAADPLLPPEPVAAVSRERDAAAAAVDESDPLLAADPESLDTGGIRALTDDLRGAAVDLGDGEARVLTALDDLITATRESAAGVESANFSAENAPRLNFRDAVAALEDGDDEAVAEGLLGYLDAARALEASHADEIAEKSGPLLDSRLAVEEFARSIAGGALLEFDWAPTVNGYGTGGSYGGTSYWWSDRGGYATVTLSDSVAAMWPGDGVQSLVAHEAGHAILSTCAELFFGTEYEAGGEESWATAWAIGMGYTADGSGESIYGRPADALIAQSTLCR